MKQPDHPPPPSVLPRWTAAITFAVIFCFLLAVGASIPWLHCGRLPGNSLLWVYDEFSVHLSDISGETYSWHDSWIEEGAAPPDSYPFASCSTTNALSFEIWILDFI